MKKMILLAILGLSYFFADAQGKSKIQYGVKGGLNFATWGGENVNLIGDRKNRVSIHAGGLVNIPVTKNISIQPELLFSGEGVRYENTVWADKQNLTYLNIPVLGMYNHPSGFFAETGPQIGFLLSAKIEKDGDSGDNKDYFKSNDFKWAFGVGYKIRSGLGVGLRYNLGLAQVYDRTNFQVKNKVFAVMLFYTFSVVK